jgi:hypothetical protein
MARESNKEFYCGEIVSQGVGGRRATECRTDLGTAEKALIVCLRPELNERLRRSDPDDCVVVYSRFFDNGAGETRVPSPAKFPLLIAYDSWTKTWDAGRLITA